MKKHPTTRLNPIGATLLLALSLQASPLYAAEYLLTPVSPRALGAKKLESLLKSGGAAIEVVPLFGAGEAKALAALGDGKLASTLKVRTRSSAQDARLRRRALRAGWSADLNSRAELQEKSSFESLQWGLRNTGEAQKLTLSETRTLMIPGSAGEDSGYSRAPAPRADAPQVTVAVLDTGVDSTHPDLAGKVIRPPADPDAPIPADSLSDDIGHGTHVAGVIAAQGQVTGVASGVAQILPVKVIKRAPNAPIRPQDASPPAPGTPAAPATKEGAFADDIARGLLYAVRHDARIINLSLAWPKAADAEVLRRMVQLAQARGVLVVSAAGNDASQGQVFPCSYNGVICVAAHGPDGALSHFSNYGAAADVAAPGLAILSTWPLKRQPSTFTAFQGYELKNGTSMAAPFVSGILARLLAEGMSPAEARARLLVGVRPVQEPAWESEALLARLRKWISRGNADLSRALSVPPQPLFEAASKTPLSLRWQPALTRSLPLRLELRNAWADAQGPVGASLRLVSFEGGDSRDSARNPMPLPARLSVTSWSTPSWKAGESRSIETSLEITDASRLESRYLVEITVGGNRVRIPLALSRLMDPSTQVAGSATAGAFVGAPLQLDESADIRSVNPRDGRTDLEFFAIRESMTAAESSGEKDRKLVWGLQRMSRISSDGRLVISVSAPSAMEPGSFKDGLSLYQIDRLRAADGSARYAFVALLGTAVQGATPRARITVLTENLEKDQVIEHDNTVSALPDTFRWMAMASGTPRPAWIGAGTTPPLEKKPYNPWNPKASSKDQPERRFYYLAADGIRSLAAPDNAAGKKQDWVALLQPSTEDFRDGRIRALLASGDDYNVSYSVARIRNALIESTETLELAPFRMLDGIAQTGRMQALAPGFEGTFYSGAGTLGALRTTLVYAGNPRPETDLRQAPLSGLDSAMSTLGVFAGPSTLASFVETHSALQFHDHRTGEIAVTSLGRYSFLPTFIFSQSYFPLLSAEGPALLVPSELGTPDGVGILRPTRDASGALTLTRPARDQWESGDSCLRIGNPIRDPQGDRIAWLCSSGWWEVSF